MTNTQKEIIKSCADPETKLTYTIRVVGEIITSSDTHVYGKHCPYPASLR